VKECLEMVVMFFGKKDIVSKFRQGNHKAFKLLYDKHFDSLYLFGLRYIRTQNVVEDIVQDSFIKAWERKEDFNEEISFKSFLYKTVRNSSLNYISHEKVKEKFIHFHSNILEEDVYFDDNIVREELNQRIASAIEDLPEAARKIYSLSLEGLKNNEIAEDLSISVNTVKTQKQRASKFVRQRVLEFVSILLLFFY
jgi:RNA polymerase sigma-70 factor (ECF subfamily)